MESPFAIPLHPRDIVQNLANGHWNCIKYFLMELFTDNDAWGLSLSPSHAESSCDPLRIMMFLLLKAQLTWAALYSRICELNCWCEAHLTRSTNDSSMMRMNRAAIPVGLWVPPLFVTATCFHVAIPLGNCMWLCHSCFSYCRIKVSLVDPKNKVSLFTGRQIVRYGYIHTQTGNLDFAMAVEKSIWMMNKIVTTWTQLLCNLIVICKRTMVHYAESVF